MLLSPPPALHACKMKEWGDPIRELIYELLQMEITTYFN